MLTAGHNLISKKTKAKYLTVLRDGATVDEGGFKVCPEYELNPTEKNAVHDYGVVLLPKDASKTREGFGLNLSFSSDEDIEGQVCVQGYRDTSDKPVTSWGPIVASGTQLEYKAATEQGMSGSPVWAAYDGLAVAVGIQ